MFLYLGRRGLSRFALELAQAIADMPDIEATFCISRQNELFREFARSGCRLLPVDTFETAGGAISRGYRARTLYRNVLGELTQRRSAGVVTLMPHVWTPLVAPLIRATAFAISPSFTMRAGTRATRRACSTAGACWMS
jgi:hypothetical protein